MAKKKRNPLIKKLRRDIVYVIILAAVGFFRFVPRKLALAIGGAVGWILPFLARKECRLAEKHLVLAFGREKSGEEIRLLARDMFRNLALNFIDTVRLKAMTTEEILAITIPHGVENMHKALAKGKGIIGLTSHAGCWEHLGVYLAIIGVPTAAIAARLYDPRLEKLLVDNRMQGGIKNMSRGQDTREIIRALKQGYLVGALIDQDVPKLRGEFVDFFGVPAFTPTGPAILSLKYEAPIVPIMTYRDKDHNHHACIGEPVIIEPTGDLDRDAFALTAACSNVIEDFIRAHPEQWVWFHRRWNTRPEAATAKMQPSEGDASL